MVLCEDCGGVKTYIKQLTESTLLKSAVAVEVQGIGEGPKKLLQYAKMALNGNTRKFPNKADMVFLIFDKDQHEGFDNAVAGSRDQNRIHVFTSIPCIEIFFILHYEYFSHPANRYSDLSGVLKAIPEFEKYNKGSGSVPIVSMCNVQDTAMKNVARLRKERRKNGSKNPMTDMDLYIEFLNDIKVNGLDNIVGNNDERFLHNDP